MRARTCLHVHEQVCGAAASTGDGALDRIAGMVARLIVYIYGMVDSLDEYDRRIREKRVCVVSKVWTIAMYLTVDRQLYDFKGAASGTAPLRQRDRTAFR